MNVRFSAPGAPGDAGLHSVAVPFQAQRATCRNRSTVVRFPGSKLPKLPPVATLEGNVTCDP